MHANNSSDLYDKVITVIVSSPAVAAEKSFSVYRQLLCSSASYFDKLLNGGFAEAGSDPIRLKDVSVKTFQSFYLWLNSGYIDLVDGVTSGKICQAWHHVIDAYIFADFYDVPAFKNDLADYLYHYTEQTKSQSTSILQKLYENTKDGDLMRKLVVDMSARAGKLQGFHIHGLVYPKQYLFEYICSLRANNIAPGGRNFDPKSYRADMLANFCTRYHHHPETEKAEGAADIT